MMKEEVRDREALARAEESVIFLEWALAFHRGEENRKGAVWRNREAEYIRQLEEARKHLASLKAALKSS
jgi:hypothetical protein